MPRSGGSFGGDPNGWIGFAALGSVVTVIGAVAALGSSDDAAQNARPPADGRALEAIEQAEPTKPNSDEAPKVYRPQSSSSPTAQQVHFIVRFNKDADVSKILERFRQDPEAARAAYDDLCERFPELRQMVLVKTSYSGEVILAFKGRPRNAADVTRIKEMLQNLPIVRYADPDFTAKPGDTRP